MNIVELIAQAYGQTVIRTIKADAVSESTESDALLAREAATGVLQDYDDEPQAIHEVEDGGFVVSGEEHMIFMGTDGSVDLQSFDSVGEEDEDDFDDDDDLELEDDDEDEEAEDLDEDFDYTPSLLLEVDPSRFFGEEAVSDEQYEAADAMLTTVLHGTPEGQAFLAEVNARLAHRFESVLSDSDALDKLQDAVSEIMPGLTLDEAGLGLLSAFDEAKDDGDVGRAISAAQAIAEAAEVELDLDEAGLGGYKPGQPKPPVDQGPGKGKSTTQGGGGGRKAGVPAPGKPKKPYAAGTQLGKGKSGGGPKRVRREDVEEDEDIQGMLVYASENEVNVVLSYTTDEGEKALPPMEVEKAETVLMGLALDTNVEEIEVALESAETDDEGDDDTDEAIMDLVFPKTRLSEFQTIAEAAGATNDAPVAVDGDTVRVTLPKPVATKARLLFKGEGVSLTEAVAG